MKEGGTGGANTKTGLQFEERTDLRQIFESIPGYQLKPAADRRAMKSGLITNCWHIVSRSGSFTVFLPVITLNGMSIFPSG